jgi:hypothetical protein
MTAFTSSMFFWLLASIAAAGGAAASPASPTPAPPGCAAPAPVYLRVHLINDAGAVPRMLDDALAEAAKIWIPAGLRLAWTAPPTSFGAADPGTVILIVRRAQSRRSGAGSVHSRAVPDPPLGWVLFDGDDKRGFIEVSLDAITSVVMRGVYQNRSVADLPRRAQTDLLGRGLGRVIAHEIGHWRMGREHAREGLMKESFNPQDLIDWVAAWFPRPAGECGERRER